ncbi:MAG: hypothetical protein JWN39_3239 [Ilumatobacteraceae bacterium]|nr:hypothetical protein [Ilumatobacteraceae bacterium]
MKTRHALVAVLVCTLGVSACSSDSRQSLKTDLETAASDVSNAAGDVANNAAEALARNIATQQGEEQFKNAGQELSGALSCDATVNDGVTKIDVNCTGTTKAGGKAALTGSTNEVPGASVTELDGQFTGTVDGAQVFSTQRLGG